jgi:hypothetical protein
MRFTAIVVLVLASLGVACDRSPRAAGFTDTTNLSKDSTVTASENATTSDAPARAATTKDEHTAGLAAPSRTREVTLPVGTQLPLVLDTAVASDTSRAEEAVRAHLARPVVIDGVAILPTGSDVSGVVTSAVRSGRVKGRAHIAVRFESLTRRGESERYRIATSALARTAPATKKADTVRVLAPAAGGALIGRIAGGRKGALVGTAVGAGAGSAVVMSTRGKEVRLGKGALVTVRLSKPLTVRVPT